MSELTRLSVNMNESTAEALRAIMAAEGITATETIRRLVSLGKFLQDERLHGSRVYIQRESDWRELVFL